MTKTLAIITARGGSKRIPGKNIREFCGRPIICYSIRAAIESGCFDEVMVSTDDSRIAEVALKTGAKVPFLRSKDTADDCAVTSDVLKEVLYMYKNFGRLFDFGCCIYPTAPFVSAKIINEAMSLLVKDNADTVLPVVAYSFPPQRAIVIKDGLAHMQFPEYLNKRSQDLEPIYHDSGQFYAFNVPAFLKSGKLMGERVIPVIMDDLMVQDIDNESDWKIAEMKYQLIQRGMTLNEI